MRILEVLSREHKLFEGLAERLSRAVLLDEPRARGEIRTLMLLLLPALDKHEEIEEVVFGEPYAAVPGAREVLARVDAQHRRLEALREDLTEALREAQSRPFPSLKALVEQLVGGLREHLHTEEAHLWPHFREAAGRSLNGSIARRADEAVQALEKDLERRAELIADYLRRKP